MMLEKQLSKYRFFSKIGAYSIEPNSPKGILKSLGYTVSLLRQGHGRLEPSKLATRPRPVLAILIGFALLTFYLFSFQQIDIHTVVSWRP